MPRTRREQVLRAVLVLYGVLAVCLYPLMRVWPAGWRWTPYGSSYEHMLIAVYATLGVCLMLAVPRPERHRSLVLFAGWSSLAHAGFMAYDAWRHAGERSHLVGDVPLVALGGVLLLLLAPRRAEQPRSA
jgi:uncharacterized protein DUF6632